MSHGNVVVAVGDCPVCGRQGVDLTEYRQVVGQLHRPQGKFHRACADEFACASAWGAARHRAYQRGERSRP